jgi:Arc/MetJ-type ribon-helix-helix transcriptional regulator
VTNVPTIELSLPDKMDSEITRFVDQGEFINREQAIEELLTTGISAYDVGEDSTEETLDDSFTHMTDEYQDPAKRD